jgi:hypothetical protein
MVIGEGGGGTYNAARAKDWRRSLQLRGEAEYEESKKRVVRVLWKWGGPRFVKHNIVRYLG